MCLWRGGVNCWFGYVLWACSDCDDDLMDLFIVYSSMVDHEIGLDNKNVEICSA